MGKDLYRDVMDSLSAQIAILDKSGMIIETNRSWREFGRENGLEAPFDSIGCNYLEVCDRSGEDSGELTAAGIRRVLAGELREFNMQYPCHSPAAERWFVVRAVQFRASGTPRVIVSHENITPVIEAQEDLRRKEAELTEQKKMLQDSNIALEVLLEHRSRDRIQVEENVFANIRKLVKPYLKELHRKLDEKEANLVSIIESRLDEITAPFLNRLTSLYSMLSPREIDVAVLVREGRSSKEIAELLTVSVSAVDFHRKRIRKKLGLSNEKANLRSYLLSLR